MEREPPGRAAILDKCSGQRIRRRDNPVPSTNRHLFVCGTKTLGGAVFEISERLLVLEILKVERVQRDCKYVAWLF